MPTGALSKIDDPAELAELCGQAGARVRATAKGGWMVHGPDGSCTIPPKWANGRSRENVLSHVSQAGIDLSEPSPPRPAAEDDEAPVPDKLVIEERPRPTLAEGNSTLPTASTGPDRADDPEGFVLGLVEDLQSQLDNLSAQVERLIHQLDVERGKRTAFANRVGALEDLLSEYLRGATRAQDPVEVEHQRQREAVMTFMKTLPLGMKMGARSILDNVDLGFTSTEQLRPRLDELVSHGQLACEAGGRGRVRLYSVPGDVSA